MGLDMYLSANYYVKNWDFMKSEEKWEITVKKGGNPVNLDNITNLKVEIGYWRKCNAIHNWFVKNCANGVDDCRPVYVEREMLSLLLDEVNAVLKDKTRARDKLPTASGFFFGSTDYGDYYLEDLQRTKTILEKALEMRDCEFEYRASW